MLLPLCQVPAAVLTHHTTMPTGQALATQNLSREHRPMLLTDAPDTILTYQTVHTHTHTHKYTQCVPHLRVKEPPASIWVDREELRP